MISISWLDIYFLLMFRSLPEIDGLSKETVLTSWMAKFDCIFKGDDDTKRPGRNQQQLNSEMILSKEQLYDMFQQILMVKKFEHQLLFNALQVTPLPFPFCTPTLTRFDRQLDSSDEQTAAIRRELDGRMQKVSEMERNRKLMPKFVLKEMESLYIEELKASINTLMANLENVPVSKGSDNSKYGIKLKRYNHRCRSALACFKKLLPPSSPLCLSHEFMKKKTRSDGSCLFCPPLCEVY